MLFGLSFVLLRDQTRGRHPLWQRQCVSGEWGEDSASSNYSIPVAEKRLGRHAGNPR
jgi:hypothetical protein